MTDYPKFFVVPSAPRFTAGLARVATTHFFLPLSYVVAAFFSGLSLESNFMLIIGGLARGLRLNKLGIDFVRAKICHGA